MPDALEGLNSTALLLCVTFLAYVAMILTPYLRERPGAPGRAEDFEWHFLIPCLNEDVVIGRTVSWLLFHRPEAHVWCIDDDSDDQTGALLARLEAACPNIHLVSRRAPLARDGKGAALNAGWRALRGYLGPEVDRSRVVVGVLDADGRLDPAAYDVLAGERYFADPEVGAVQIEVRMVNLGREDSSADQPAAAGRSGRLLVELQDLEFRTVIAGMQILRRHTASVGMGGNGQFTRMSTLDLVAQRAGTPWHGALLEDFELGVHILLEGQRTEYAHHTWVAQEGLTSLRSLLRQRSRWAQGAMQCSKYLPSIMGSPTVRTPAAMELGYFLLLPWIQILGTIVYFCATGVMVYYALTTVGGFPSWLGGGGWGVVPLVALFGLVPFALWGFVYRARCAPHLSRRKAMALGLANWLYSYVHALAIWMALVRVVRARNDWIKTERIGVPGRGRHVASASR